MVNSSESGKYNVKYQISPCLQLFKKILFILKYLPCTSSRHLDAH